MCIIVEQFNLLKYVLLNGFRLKFRSFQSRKNVNLYKYVPEMNLYTVYINVYNYI